MAIIDIKVPDIGDFAEVAIIEVMVQPGDTIKAEQSLITVESDKASMEIPSSHAGVVKELKVKLGDKIHEGSVVLTLETQNAGAAPAPVAAPVSAPAPAQNSEQKQAPAQAPQALATTNSVATSFSGTADMDCDLLVLGGGPGGYSAAFRAADLGLKVVLVERYATLGGVCLNVGCIPSKALLHVAAVMDEVGHLAAAGIEFGAPKVSVDGLRGHKEKVVGKLTGGLAAMAKMRKVTIVHSISAGLDYPGVGPEHAYLLKQGRTEYVAVKDKLALDAFQELAREEGIIPALESAHAVAAGGTAWRRAGRGIRALCW